MAARPFGRVVGHTLHGADTLQGNHEAHRQSQKTPGWGAYYKCRDAPCGCPAVEREEKC